MDEQAKHHIEQVKAELDRFRKILMERSDAIKHLKALLKIYRKKLILLGIALTLIAGYTTLVLAYVFFKFVYK